MKIYTRTGDDGTTSLRGAKRVPKFHQRIEACGTVDELISWIGLLRSHKELDKIEKGLQYIQEQLMLCAGILASDTDASVIGDNQLDDGIVTFIEKEIDTLEKNLPRPAGFLIPGSSIVESYCHITRCVCRRAERAVAKLNSMEKIPSTVPKFLNRLSDYFFVLSRFVILNVDL